MRKFANEYKAKVIQLQDSLRQAERTRDGLHGALIEQSSRNRDLTRQLNELRAREQHPLDRMHAREQHDTTREDQLFQEVERLAFANEQLASDLAASKNICQILAKVQAQQRTYEETNEALQKNWEDAEKELEEKCKMLDDIHKHGGNPAYQAGLEERISMCNNSFRNVRELYDRQKEEIRTLKEQLRKEDQETYVQRFNNQNQGRHNSPYDDMATILHLATSVREVAKANIKKQMTKATDAVFKKPIPWLFFGTCPSEDVLCYLFELGSAKKTFKISATELDRLLGGEVDNFVSFSSSFLHHTYLLTSYH